MKDVKSTITVTDMAAVMDMALVRIFPINRPGRFLIAAAFAVITFLGALQAAAQEKSMTDTVQLSEIEVFAGKVPIVPMQTVRLKECTALPLRDIGDFLRQEPNISGIRKGGIALDPVIRGFRFNQLTAILDGGITIEGGCPNRMDPATSHVESEVLSTIQVVRGPYVFKYGPVMGAMLNLERSKPVFYSKPELHGKVLYGFETNWNGQREHAELAGGNKVVSFRGSAGYKGYGSYRSGSGEMFSTSFNKSYATFATAFRISPSHQLTVNYSYDQGTGVQYPALPMDEQIGATNVASLNYLASGLGKVIKTLEVQGYYTSVHHVMNNYQRPSAATMRAVTTVDAGTCGGKAVATIPAGRMELVTGVDFLHILKDGDKQMSMKMVMGGDTFTSVKMVNVFNRAVLNNAGLFGEIKSAPGRTEFSAGFRIDFNQANSSDTSRLVKDGIDYFNDLASSFVNLSLNAGVKTRLATGLFITASASAGTRSPSILERFIKLMPVQYDSYDYLGNPQLRPEHNYQADVSLDYLHVLAGSFTAGGFFSLVRDYILGVVLPPTVIKPSTQGVLGVKQFTNVSSVYLYGFEFGYRSPSRYSWELAATAAGTWGINPTAVKYLVSGGSVTGEEEIRNDPLPEIPPFEGDIRFSYRFFKGKFIPGVSLRMVSAQKRVSKAFSEQTTPGFMTTSLSLSYLPCRYFNVNAGATNLFGKNYYEHLDRRIVGSSSNLYEPGTVYYVTLTVQF